jgi:hypothetical protein
MCKILRLRGFAPEFTLSAAEGLRMTVGCELRLCKEYGCRI